MILNKGQYKGVSRMTSRTSESSPLQIAEVILEPDSGTLGLTICPGKKDRGRNWNRDLSKDLQAIRDWGATTVVSLIEDQEFKMLGVESLGQDVRRLGMHWLHLPIVDVNIPDSRFESSWAIEGPQLHRRISVGEKILIHCRGGLGRTGLVAARILVERGCLPRIAIHRVRAVRPRAIETPAQENYVNGCKPLKESDLEPVGSGPAASEIKGTAKVSIRDICTYKILQMVGVLHARGYQRLRVFPSARSMWWKCTLAPGALFDPANGACMESRAEYDIAGLVASCGITTHPFGWKKSIETMSPAKMATKFVEDFPALAKASMGSDWPYAGWFQELLMLTAPGIVPIAYYSDEYETTVYEKVQLSRTGYTTEEQERFRVKEMAMPPLYEMRESDRLTIGVTE
jgi:ADP-ribosyl-[dinitrogen reductase] hydrolase